MPAYETMFAWSIGFNLFFIWIIVGCLYFSVMDNVNCDLDESVMLLMCVFWPVIMPLHIIKALCRFIGNL